MKGNCFYLDLLTENSDLHVDVPTDHLVYALHVDVSIPHLVSYALHVDVSTHH